MNINEILFKGDINERKNAVENASESDLLRLSEDSIKRMVKEKGTERYGGRKVLYFKRVSNHWNADAKDVELSNNKLFIDIYVQYGNTDTDECEYMSKFLGSGDYRGTIHYEDRYGNPQTSYYRFDRADKANVMRAICLAYLNECEKK